jgi:hypothetical protein
VSGGDHRWFKRSTGEKRPVTRDIHINNNNNNNNDDDDDDDDDDNNNNNNNNYYFILCGYFNFLSSYSMAETSHNMMFGITGLLITSTFFCGGSLMWLICPTPSVICLPHYLKFLTLFVVFTGG